MRAVDEKSQILGRTIESTGRKEVHSIVTPAKLPGKIGDRHHLEQSDSVLFQQRQFFRGRAPGSFRREDADVHFIHDLPRHLDSLPSLIGPFELRRIDYTGRAVRSFGLKSRSWIGIKIAVAVYPESIQRPHIRADCSRKVSARLGLEFVKLPFDR